MLLVLLLVFAAYTVGSIPTGYWFAKFFFNIDVTQHGSGNIGATNVARVLGHVKYFFLIFFIDATKAFMLLLFAQMLLEPLACKFLLPSLLCLISAALILGNSCSMFLGWRGGKSVATLTGILLFLFPLSLVLIGVAFFGAIFLVTRQVFIGSIIAPVVLSLLYWIFYYQVYGFELGVFLTGATVWLVARHHSNIKKFFHV